MTCSGCQNPRNRLTRLGALVVLLGLAWTRGYAHEGQEGQHPVGSTLQYNRDIRPILAEHCFACHGPDSAARKADLRLDQRQVAIDLGAIVPGKPQESGLVERIQATDPEMVMPPPATKKKLSPQQKEMLVRWIAEGAEYQPHWSLIPPQRPPVPAVRNAAWVRNPIDAFILAKLEVAGLSPAPEADRRTLARRLSLDLTGLPPSPELVEAFVNNPSPRAYEELVETLLQSPHWGEHRGRYWLDAARYADTHGIHFDNYREIWAYRDWVIDAFNQNMPFDRFVIEQLAGDLLPQPTLEQKVATGFCRCNITTNEGGIIDEEYKVLYARDRTETFGQVFLGMTAGCAVCHDHKFDPLTMRDFYSLSAFFDNTTQPVRDGNIKDTPPVVVVPRREDRPRWAALEAELAELQGKLAARREAARPAFEDWLHSASTETLAAYVPRDGLILAAPLDEGKGQAVKLLVAGQEQMLTRSEPLRWTGGPGEGTQALAFQTDPALELGPLGDFEADQGFSVSLWVRLGRRNQTGAILARMDDRDNYRGWDVWLEADKVGMHLIHHWNDNAIKVVCQTPLKPNEWTHVCVVYDGSRKARGVRIYYDGQPQPVSIAADRLRDTIRTHVPLKLGQRHGGQKLTFFAVTDLQMFDRPLTPPQASQLAVARDLTQVLAKPADQRSRDEQERVFRWYLATLDEESRALDAQVKAREEESAQIRARGTVAHVMQERPGEPVAYILFRGEYDKRRDAVKADTPAVLPPMPPDLPRNRLGLAQWLIRPEHPLFARVTVNRFWQELFGTGIVRTSGDFGVAGELPSHPELLDWLAVEFRESGWDVKRLFTLLVTSSTYRQAALNTPEKRAKDPDNRLLSRGPRFRMDAEMIRDYALAASGLLVRKLGGPSVKPYQPDGVWEAVAMIGSNTRDYRRDSGENLYRRSLYTFWKRSAPPASLEIFNAPNRETCVVRRERTNTPLQALVTLNDVQFVEAARVLAQRVLTQPVDSAAGSSAHSTDSEAARIDACALRLLARPLRPEEMREAQAALADLSAYYEQHPEDAAQLIAFGETKAPADIPPPRLAAWTMLVNTLMNLDEVLNK